MRSSGLESAIPEEIVFALAVSFTLLVVLLTGVVTLALAVLMAKRPTETTPAAPSFAERGLRKTADGTWVGQLDERVARVRSIPGVPGGRPRWSLELDLADAELETFNVPPEAVWRTGDTAFDQVFRVSSDPHTIGLLPAPVRRQLLALAPRVRAHVIAGQLELQSSSLPLLASRADQAVDAARQLDAAAVGPVEDRLERLVEADPVDAVRAQALAVLRDINGERATAVARQLAPSRSPLLEMERALLVSDAEALATLVLDDTLATPLRARAGLAAARLLNPERCAELARVLAAPHDATLNPSALELAGRAGPLGIPVLLQLVRSFDASTASGATDWLGRVANVSVVAELETLASRSSTRHAVRLRDAIRRIQERVTVGRGELSLSTQERQAGAVSVARPDRRGTLSEG